VGTTTPHPRARHPGPSVDVVLVHGLMGTPLTTWRVGDAPSTRASEVIESPKAGASSAAASTSVHLWPVEWLVRDLGQRGASVRLLSVEYNGNMTSGWHSHPPRDLEELARVLRHQLHAASECPQCCECVSAMLHVLHMHACFGIEGGSAWCFGSIREGSLLFVVP
jgi:hypothetical protein